MSYDLFIGHPSYSSWSLRAWLLVHRFDLPCRIVDVDIYTGGKDRDLAPVAPARTVPVLRLPDGTAVADSLAIAESLHELFPEAGLWPDDASQRALARSLTAEMHSGFTALRGACPMVLTHVVGGLEVTPAIVADLQRIAALWHQARESTGGAGPWLFGAYSIVDAFFAPVAMRIAGYELNVPPEAHAYVEAHLADASIVEWRRMGASKPLEPPPYDVPGPRKPWPGE